MFEKKSILLQLLHYYNDYSHWIYHVTYILRWMAIILNDCFNL